VGEISYLDVNASNEIVASGSFDYTIRTWFLGTGTLAAVLLGHGDIVSECHFCPTVPHLLLSTSWDGTLRMWDAYKDSAAAPPLVLDLKPAAGAGEGGGSGAGGSGRGRSRGVVAETTAMQAQAATESAAAARAAQAAAAQAAAQGLAPEDRDAPQGAVLCAGFSASGELFSCGTTMCKSHVWFLDVATVRASMAVPEPAHVRAMPKIGGHLHDVVSVDFSHSGAFLLTASRDGQGKIWGLGSLCSPTTGANPARGRTADKSWKLQQVLTTPADAEALRLQARMRRGVVVYAMQQALWSLDDRMVVAAMSDFTLRVWDVASGVLVHTLRLHTNKVPVIQCHPLDPRLAISAGHDGRVAVWDLEAGKCVRKYDGSEFDTQVLDGQWSPDGTRIMVSDEKGQWCIFGTGCGKGLQRAKYEQFFAVEFLQEEELVRDNIGRVALVAHPTVSLHQVGPVSLPP